MEGPLGAFCLRYLVVTPAKNDMIILTVNSISTLDSGHVTIYNHVNVDKGIISTWGTCPPSKI